MMQHGRFKHLACDFTTGGYIRRGVFDAGITDFNHHLSPVLLALVFACAVLFSAVQHNCDQAVGFHFSRIGKRKMSFHGLTPVSSARRQKRNSSPLIPALPCPRSHSVWRQARSIERRSLTSSV